MYKLHITFWRGADLYLTAATREGAMLLANDWSKDPDVIGIFIIAPLILPTRLDSNSFPKKGE